MNPAFCQERAAHAFRNQASLDAKRLILVEQFQKKALNKGIMGFRKARNDPLRNDEGRQDAVTVTAPGSDATAIDSPQACASSAV
jgi:hypothetical protein